VQRIASAAGKPVPGGRTSTAGGSSGSGTSPLITFGAPALLVIIGAAVAARLHGRARQES
jgi:hypothetical protein